MSPSWSRAHDWKSCRRQKRLESSNLSISVYVYFMEKAVKIACRVILMAFSFGVSAKLLLKIVGILGYFLIHFYTVNTQQIRLDVEYNY